MFDLCHVALLKRGWGCANSGGFAWSSLKITLHEDTIVTILSGHKSMHAAFLLGELFFEMLTVTVTVFDLRAIDLFSLRQFRQSAPSQESIHLQLLISGEVISHTDMQKQVA